MEARGTNIEQKENIHNRHRDEESERGGGNNSSELVRQGKDKTASSSFDPEEDHLSPSLRRPGTPLRCCASV